MLQDGASLVLLDALWHHVQDVMHHSCSQLQVKVRLNALLSHLQSAHRLSQLLPNCPRVNRPADDGRCFQIVALRYQAC